MAPRLITLISNDQNKTEFKVDRELLRASKTIDALLVNLGMDEEDNETQSVSIPLDNVSPDILQRVIRWLEYHKDDAPVPEKTEAEADRFKEKRTDDISEWDQKFLKVEQSILYDIILAANYLDIENLLDTACKTVANLIKNKSSEEIRKTFNIKSDFTKEEEAQIKKENAWCEE